MRRSRSKPRTEGVRSRRLRCCGLDLDSEAELKVFEDIEIADNEGLTLLPGVADLLAALPRNRWTAVTSATERLARLRMAAGGIAVPRRLVTAVNT